MRRTSAIVAPSTHRALYIGGMRFASTTKSKAERSADRAKRDAKRKREREKPEPTSVATTEAEATPAKPVGPPHPGAEIDLKTVFVSKPSDMTIEDWTTEKQNQGKWYEQLDLHYDSLKAGNHMSDLWYKEYAVISKPLRRGLRKLIALQTRHIATKLQYNTLKTAEDGTVRTRPTHHPLRVTRMFH